MIISPNEIERAVAALRNGQLVAFPTETVYGLGADASNPTAVRRIFAAKGRPADHPLIGLPNVLHTPHLAASTTDAQVNVGVDAARLIVEALTTSRYQNVCNQEVLTTLNSLSED